MRRPHHQQIWRGGLVKKRHPKKTKSHSSLTADAEALHFRLCHVCLHLSESDSDIVQCQRCQRYLTIESLVEERLKRARGGSEEEQEMIDEHEAVFESGSFRRKGGGLAGLAVLW